MDSHLQNKHKAAPKFKTLRTIEKFRFLFSNYSLKFFPHKIIGVTAILQVNEFTVELEERILKYRNAVNFHRVNSKLRYA